MAKLVLLRHGQSVWNKKNIFTGWVDVPLSEEGIKEARKAGQRIAHLSFDLIFVSTLIRAQMSMYLALLEQKEPITPVMVHEGMQHKQETHFGREHLIPVYAHTALNERMYGQLQGLNKDEVREKFGAEQVHIWRRSYDVAPPGGESLALCAARTLPYFRETVVPYLKEGKNVLISAHGNSLRSIVMDLKQLSKEEVVELEIPTGEPLLFEYQSGKFEQHDLS
ncbi:MAG: 2,3-bisphosphoglycerate-dependent phosphoglycerate mutase [Simkaniaceae bacterium]|nr:2,3-bisphosphoglycerate-dependent phosphoglycerate mutase [Simkaniaceae bacterium]